jgi:hypothetical protein
VCQQNGATLAVLANEHQQQAALNMLHDLPEIPDNLYDDGARRDLARSFRYIVTGFLKCMIVSSENSLRLGLARMLES